MKKFDCIDALRKCIWWYERK